MRGFVQRDRHLHGEEAGRRRRRRTARQQRLVTGEELQRGVGENKVRAALSGVQVAMSCLTKRGRRNASRAWREHR